jgi:hypothetical protein
LPDYWVKLVDPDSITVHLTPVDRDQALYVKSVGNNQVTVGNSNIVNRKTDCFYIVYAERADVEKLEVEVD